MFVVPPKHTLHSQVVPAAQTLPPLFSDDEQESEDPRWMTPTDRAKKKQKLLGARPDDWLQEKKDKDKEDKEALADDPHEGNEEKKDEELDKKEKEARADNPQEEKKKKKDTAEKKVKDKKDDAGTTAATGKAKGKAKAKAKGEPKAKGKGKGKGKGKAKSTGAEAEIIGDSQEKTSLRNDVLISCV